MRTGGIKSNKLNLISRKNTKENATKEKVNTNSNDGDERKWKVNRKRIIIR